MSNDLSRFLERVRPAIESTLDQLLPPENASPARIHQAMRYSTMDGGKRVRPCLCVAAFAAYEDDWKKVLPVACAIEMIHAYSLIHDDLPAMDDDDFRRGKPSCHKQFDEAIAILAGDGLLTLAFEVLGRTPDFAADRMIRVVSMLGTGAGSASGMVGGQVLDLEAEGTPVTVEQLEAIHRWKTAALIGVSVRIGAYLGGASDSEFASISLYADRIGLLFQVVDDILDATDGSNRDEGKATYPGIYGLEKSRAIAHEVTQEARNALEPLGSRAGLLRAFSDFLEKRTQ
jgi:geranylgeranyl diphosphate synthase type II